MLFCMFVQFLRTCGNLPQASCTDKKENSIYKEIQMGSGAKSYIRKEFLIYEEIYFYHI
jgi:hypothetical protein